MPQGPIPVSPGTKSGVQAGFIFDPSTGAALVDGVISAPVGGFPVKPQGASSYNDAVGTAGDQIKSGAGVLASVTINTAGTSSTATLYDGTNTSGIKLATIDTTSSRTLNFNAAFTTGLFIVSSTVTPADITVGYY